MSLLLLVEVDHACGDILASVMDDLAEQGVMNVNLVPSLTKKGRPGYLLFIDLPRDALDAVETVIARELGVLGWRVMHAEHRHAAVEHMSREVVLPLPGGPMRLVVPFKAVSTGGHAPAVQVEHDFCVALKRQLEDGGVHMPLRTLKAQLQTALADMLSAEGAGPRAT
jgi:uncharacterized protein (DUF111 family)